MQNGGHTWDARSLLVAGLYVATCSLVAELVNRIVSDPYLDEVFHIPQAQQYCNNKFDFYHPKLTTPPGLYYISITLAKGLSRIQNLLPFPTKDFGAPCQTTAQLRYTCLLCVLILPWLLAAYRLGRPQNDERQTLQDQALRQNGTIKPTSPMEALTLAQADPSRSAELARQSVTIRERHAAAKREAAILGFIPKTLSYFGLTLEVHTISLLPPLWFFGFLYYTDVPSTILVLAMLLASRREKHWVAAAIGCASLTLRQTNIVWILFTFGVSLLDRLASLGLAAAPLAGTTGIQQLKTIANLPLWETLKCVASLALPYSPVAALSAHFIARNGSIVLGDREHHQVAMHWAQPLYCVAMMTFFAWPALISSLSQVDRRIFQRPHFVAPALSLLTMVTLAAVHYGTILHPFLLADNRHYTFYIWRKIVNRTSWTRYVLAPGYAILIFAWCAALAQENSLFWLLGFALCTCAALIPSPLIEPRYYLLPYLIARLHLFPDFHKVSPILGRRAALGQTSQGTQPRSISVQALVVEALWSLLINTATMYLFLYRPFRWSGWSEWQRFLW